MKILQVVPCFYPAWEYGGPVRAVYELSKSLVKRGHHVVVCTSDNLSSHSRAENPDKYINVDGVHAHYFRNISRNLTRISGLRIAPELARYLRQQTPAFDVLHLHEFRTFQSLVGSHYARKYHIPYVLSAHGTVPKIMQRQKQKVLFDVLFGYRILREAACLIALTKVEAEQYRHAGIVKDRIRIVPNGISPSEFIDLPEKGMFRRKYDVAEEEKVVLFLGRIHKIKGLDVLVKAFRMVSKEMSNVTLVIAGPDCGYIRTLRELIMALEIQQKVIFTGPIFGKDKLAAYIDSDAYVLPSRSECMPITVLEACACGIPVIVTKRCGIADVVDNNVGLVTSLNELDLCDAMLRILGNAELRRRFTRNSSDFVKDRFTWDRIVGKLERIYAMASTGQMN